MFRFVNCNGKRTDKTFRKYSFISFLAVLNKLLQICYMLGPVIGMIHCVIPSCFHNGIAHRSVLKESSHFIYQCQVSNM